MSLERMFQEEADTLAFLLQEEFTEDLSMESIAYKLSWEMVAMNDAGEASAQARLALEIALGVANANSDPASFSSIMTNVIESVSNKEMKRLLGLYMRRGLK